MKYRINGAVRDTGEEVNTTVTAESPEAAEREASRHGIFVASIRHEPDVLEVGDGVKKVAGRAVPLEYARPRLATAVAQNAVIAPPPLHSGERSIYWDGTVLVTDARIVFANKTYALANVTSVEMHRIDASSTGAGYTVMAGVVLFIWGLVNCFRCESGGDAAFAAVLLLIGAGLGVVGVRWGWSLRPVFALGLSDSSGEHRAMQSPSAKVIQQIVAAVNEAMVRRRQ